MNYAGQRVLITGGLGFIGSSLARRLLELNADVTVVDNLEPKYGGNRQNVADLVDRLSVCIGDIRDESILEDLVSGRAYIFNLAAQTSHVDSMREPHADLAINAQGQLSILEACRRVNPETKLVFTSTRQLYGKPAYLPVDELHPIHPVDVNGVSKLAGEQFHILYNDVYGIRSCVLRLTNTYGPGMRVKDARQTFLGVWVRRLIEGDPIQIFGDGLQLRDFTYVDDCVEALLLAGQNEMSNGHIYNVGGAEVVNLLQLAQMMKALVVDARLEIVEFPPDRKAIDIGDYYSDYSLLKRELGWTPKVPLATGLATTLEYYRRNRQFYL